MNLKDWKNNLLGILKKYKIHNPKSFSIYMEAFTHSSYAHEQGLKYNYERLEFLGDAAIQWVVVNYLYSRKPLMDEGEMSNIKANIVKSDTLANAAKSIHLEKLIFLGNSVNEISNNIYEDIFEAFIGAIAQDQGIKKVSNILNETILKSYEANLINVTKDNKTKFQELIQASSSFRPHYEHIDNGKLKISKLYCINSSGQKLLYGIGEAQNFKLADQQAAKEALDKMIEK